MPRIVSLISSATEIVDALGMTPCLVGRSHECDYPEAVKALPVCTRPRIPVDADSAEIDRLVRESKRSSISVYEVFAEIIEALEPTHILTQIQCDVCAVSLRDVEAAFSRGMKGQPAVVSLQPDSLAGIWEDVRRVARSLGIEGRGEQVVAGLQKRIERIAVAAPVKVACVEWMEPLMPAGYWTPELIDLAGGVNLTWTTWDELVASDPDVIVIAPCGFDLNRTAQEAHFMTGRPGWKALRARKFLADGNAYFNRPGPRVVETHRILSEMMHPDRFAPDGCGTAWREIS